MTKKIEVELVRASGRYRVKKTMNTTTPIVGEFLAKSQVDEIIEAGEVSVAISEQRKRKSPY